MKEMLTIAEVAEELGVTTRTIRNYLAEGKLTGKKIGGQWKFHKSDIYDFAGMTIEDPVSSFLDGTDLEAMLALNLPITDIESIESLKDKLLHQYNTVYDGKNRKFFYQVLTPTKARVVIQGPPEYVISFGDWIKNTLQDYH